MRTDMPDRDNPLISPGDIIAAMGLLTRLPVKYRDPDSARGAESAWAFPLVGLVVGAIAVITGQIALAFGLSAPLVAGIMLTTLIIITGALHEDGLADTADGFWGAWEVSRRLEIMKDSRIGTYGVIALILSLGLRWIALSTIVTVGSLLSVVAVAVISRAPMVALMHALINARDTGLSSDYGRPDFNTTALSVGLAFAVGVVFLGFGAIALVIWLVLTTGAIGLITKAKIGGQTGDVLGATQQVSEIVVLFWIVTQMA